MSNFNSNTVCKAKDPKNCRYHSPSSREQLLAAIQNNDYAAYEKARKLVEAEDAAEAASFVHDEKFRNIKKMPALFVIDRLAHHATTEVNDKAAWIFEEESRPTYKRDGSSITVTENGEVFARRMVKKGKQAPNGFILAETDSFTGHSFGLEPVAQSGFYKMFKEAQGNQQLAPGTYELCGPKINGNPESLEAPHLYAHGSDEANDLPDMRNVSKEEAYKTLETIFADYKARGIEGIVWWGANGKRAKLRVKDFFGDPNRR